MARTARRNVVRINGPALRYVRETSGRSICGIAPHVGASVSFLARVERGFGLGIRVDTFNALVAELGLEDPRVIMADPQAAGSPLIAA